jgi:hypothetical protein
MRQHLTIVAVLHLLLSAFALLGGITVLTASMAAGALVGTSGAPGTGFLVGTVGSIVGIVLLALALPGLAFAYGIYKRRSWSRILGFVLSAVHLFNIPIGTLIGGYTIWVLMQPETEALLSSDRALVA